MSRSAKLAAAAAFGGLLMAIAIKGATLPPASPPSVGTESVDAPAPPLAEAMLRRCRTITEPEPACDAAWNAERRRFFRTRDRQP